MRATLNIKLRSLLFFVLYNLAGIVHSFLCIVIGPFLSFPRRYRFVNLWTRLAMWLVRVINGVHIEVTGQENLPKPGQAAVILANHQSSWETFYLQLLISPQATVLKRELLWIPFFGWGLALLKPIRINRSKGSAALKSVLRQGREKLEQGIPVVIFPEGTRQPPGTLGKFNNGGALLACQNQVPVIPVVHNSGDCWPARSLMRYPGTIRIIIGPPIDSRQGNAKEITKSTLQWINTHYPSCSAAQDC